VGDIADMMNDKVSTITLPGGIDFRTPEQKAGIPSSEIDDGHELGCVRRYGAVGDNDVPANECACHSKLKTVMRDKRG